MQKQCQSKFMFGIMIHLYSPNFGCLSNKQQTLRSSITCLHLGHWMREKSSDSEEDDYRWLAEGKAAIEIEWRYSLGMAKPAIWWRPLRILFDQARDKKMIDCCQRKLQVLQHGRHANHSVNWLGEYRWIDSISWSNSAILIWSSR